MDFLEQKKTYWLRNITITRFCGQNQLTIPRHGAEVVLDEQDLGTVSSIPVNCDNETTIKTSVAAVSLFVTYKACLNCKRKVDVHESEPESSPDHLPAPAKCKHCHFRQKIQLCPQQYTATLLILTCQQDNTDLLKLQAYDKVLRSLAEILGFEGDVTEDK